MSIFIYQSIQEDVGLFSYHQKNQLQPTKILLFGIAEGDLTRRKIQQV